MIPAPKFQKGDVVKIVETPYTDCPFGWVNEMNNYCGWETTVVDLRWNNLRETFIKFVFARIHNA